MKTAPWLVALVVLAAAAGACSDLESPSIPTSAAERVTSPAPDGRARSDRATHVFEQAFIEEMIDRSALAIRVAESCVARAVHEQLRDLCGRIAADRARDLASLGSWLSGWYGLTHEPRVKPADEKTLQRLAASTGGAFEVELIAVVTADDERAIKEARHCADKAGHDALIAFCEGLARSLQAQLDQMALWLCAWYARCKGAPDPAAEVAVVLNNLDRSLTFFDVDARESAQTVPLPGAGFPAGLAIRGSTLIVPVWNDLLLIDAQTRAPFGVVALPPGASAAGPAFLNDSIAIVANSFLNTLSVVNVRRAALVRVVDAPGFDWPREVLVHGGRVYVANAMFGGDFWMDGPGTLTVLDAATLAVLKTVPLTGWSSLRVTAGPDGRIWVLNAGVGTARGAKGSLSVVDPVALQEVEHHTGFGYLPTGLAWGPDGLAYVASGAYGVAVWDPRSDAFVRPPEQAIAPDGIPSASAAGFDGAGRLYALVARSCDGPGFAYRLRATFQVDAKVPVGGCPSEIEFFRPAP
jgi:uncharacterized protein (DUF305 family)